MHIHNLIRDLTPDEWREFTMLVSGYQVLLSKGEVPTALLDLAGVRCWFRTGRLTYYHVERIRFGDEGSAKFAGGMEVRNTPAGVWLIIATPVTGGDQLAAETRIAAAVGLLIAWGGKNVVYDKYFDMTYRYEGNQAGVWSPIVAPASLAAPDLSLLHTLTPLSTGLCSLGEADRSRVQLSLRWFADSFSRVDVDAFLSRWIAFEVLTMPDPNVKHANQLLAQAYEMTRSEAAHIFMVGRLQGFRSSVVHGGRREPIHHLLLDYLEALFVDCLYHILSAGPIGRARGLLLRQQQEIRRVLRR
jgi:hypothetical protein